MVRFSENALIIEIPCNDQNPVEYYEGLQNALYDVFWMATAKENGSQINDGANWIAAYLGPALAQLEPAARDVLNEMALTKTDERPLSAESLTDDQLLKLVQGLNVNRLEYLMKRLKLL